MTETAPRIAFVFPGQGAQHVGMGQALVERYPEARAVFAAASEACGFDLRRLCFDGPAERLAETEITQPAILTVSAAALAVLRGRGLRPGAAAGLSLGEYGALLCAEAADLPDLVALVRRRGRYMQEAVPAGRGAMAAVLGLSPQGADALCRQALAALPTPGPAGGWVLVPANFNCPGQVVISGHREAVEEAVALGRAAGARRVQLLPVSAPFHCPLMAPAAERLGPEIAAIPWRTGRVPVIANSTATVVTRPKDIQEALIAQVSSPVRWEESVRLLVDMGCRLFCEVGPGKALSAFIGRIAPEAITVPVGDPDGVEAALVAAAASGGI